MDRELRALVIARAYNRCEYCHLGCIEWDQFPFHIEHILPKQHGGTDTHDNLCLSCPECNWYKGTNIAGYVNGKLFPLYNPRQQLWRRHFSWDLTHLVGRTNIGQVTVQILNINQPARIQLREQLLFEGRFDRL